MRKRLVEKERRKVEAAATRKIEGKENESLVKAKAEAKVEPPDGIKERREAEVNDAPTKMPKKKRQQVEVEARKEAEIEAAIRRKIEVEPVIVTTLTPPETKIRAKIELQGAAKVVTDREVAGRPEINLGTEVETRKTAAQIEIRRKNENEQDKK